MTLQIPFHWTCKFVASNTRVSIVVASDTLNPSPYVSFTGTFEGGGQIVDRLREACTGLDGAGAVIALCDDWDALHLKNLAAMSPTEIQRLAGVESILASLDHKRFGEAEDFESLAEASFSNADDLIDSTDVIARIEELSGAFEAAGLDAAKLDPQASDYDTQGLPKDHPAYAYAKELAILRKLESAAEGYAPDWKYGETMIRDDHFQDYAEQFASDIDAVNSDAKWPNNHIDWEAAARELQQDYTCISFGGVDYWIR